MRLKTHKGCVRVVVVVLLLVFSLKRLTNENKSVLLKTEKIRKAMILEVGSWRSYSVCVCSIIFECTSIDRTNRVNNEKTSSVFLM